MRCECGLPLNLPAMLIGYTEFFVPVAQFNCSCGRKINAQIETMKPFTAPRSETFPPGRGEYKTTPDGVMFTCPVCKALSPIRQPTHAVDGVGVVHPSVVCPNGCGFHTMMTLKDWATANAQIHGAAKPSPME